MAPPTPSMPSRPAPVAPVDDSLVSWQFAPAFIGALIVGAALTILLPTAWLPGLQAAINGQRSRPQRLLVSDAH